MRAWSYSGPATLYLRLFRSSLGARLKTFLNAFPVCGCNVGLLTDMSLAGVLLMLSLQSQSLIEFGYADPDRIILQLRLIFELLFSLATKSDGLLFALLFKPGRVSEGSDLYRRATGSMDGSMRWRETP